MKSDQQHTVLNRDVFNPCAMSYLLLQDGSLVCLPEVQSADVVLSVFVGCGITLVLGTYGVGQLLAD